MTTTVCFEGPIEQLALALCGRPARDHWRPTPDGFERASCPECAAVGRVVSANRRGERDVPHAAHPAGSNPEAG